MSAPGSSFRPSGREPERQRSRDGRLVSVASLAERVATGVRDRQRGFSVGPGRYEQAQHLEPNRAYAEDHLRPLADS